jgi:hypothetical protein
MNFKSRLPNIFLRSRLPALDLYLYISLERRASFLSVFRSLRQNVAIWQSQQSAGGLVWIEAYNNYEQLIRKYNDFSTADRVEWGQFVSFTQ